jgi:stress response protein YsnF
MPNIIAVYDQEGIARQVVGDLVKSGCTPDDVTLIGPRQGEVSDRLSEWGVSASDAGIYSEAVRRGKAMVRAQVPEDQADRVAGLLVQRGARKLADIQQELQQSPEVLKEAHEEMSVGKTQQSGQVAAKLKVSEQPVEQTVNLKQEQVRAESRPAERKLSPEEADKAFQEKSIEMTERHEVPEVHKEAKVTQEVKLSKEAKEQQQTVRDTVRRSDVHIERKH